MGSFEHEQPLARAPVSSVGSMQHGQSSDEVGSKQHGHQLGRCWRCSMKAAWAPSVGKREHLGSKEERGRRVWKAVT